MLTNVIMPYKKMITKWKQGQKNKMTKGKNEKGKMSNDKITND